LQSSNFNEVIPNFQIIKTKDNMKTLFGRPLIFSALLYGTLIAILISVSTAKATVTVEPYDEPSEKVTEIPEALPVSVPPSNSDLDELSDVRSGPPITPTPSALTVCKQIVTNHGYKVTPVAKPKKKNSDR
jgi:hypothetical protein